ncbi:MAG: coproporphyrinogen dehydrogenase HemZ [Clostridiales bacterium]|jgi:oxygen-independent coproporphyrinogen-3 oxidase|nr:coproporphyrinogen dehydrogenase HemZ [Clostridiales bacterium]
MRLDCKEEFKNDLEELVRAFFGKETTEDTGSGILIDYCPKNGRIYAETAYPERAIAKQMTETIKSAEKLGLKRQTKRMLKKLLYETLSEITGRSLPYGSLTGVRPTKLAYELAETNDETGVKNILIDYYGVSSQKAELICEVIKNQKGVYKKNTGLYDIYINIPFCLTRCAYCSFVTTDITKTRRYIEPYVDCLLREIDLMYDISGGECNAVYIGGGTPTAIDNASLEKILRSASRFKRREFTVEAGRPDTINETNLALIKAYGADRVSVNPQSFNQRTLDAIGRNHTVRDIYDAYALAQKKGFVINTDIIAMLPGEDEADFLKTVRSCTELAPNNITVHNLALKRGSRLTLENFKNTAPASGMTDGAYPLLKESGYSPYYMYRQKYMSGNLENCGYTIAGYPCVYNIDNMEETHGILAAGSGAISKRIIADRIDRQADIKDVKGYIESIDALLLKKREFFESK